MRNITLMISVVLLMMNICGFAQDNRHLIPPENGTFTNDTMQVIFFDKDTIAAEKAQIEIFEGSAKKEIEPVNVELGSLKTWLCITFGITVLTLLLAAVSIFLLLQNKKRFRDNVLNLLKREDGERINTFKKKIVEVAKEEILKSSEYNKRAQIDQEELKRMVDAYLANKQATISQASAEAKPNLKTQKKSNILYANSIRDDGSFAGVSETHNENTTFELIIENHGIAKFTVFKSNESRVLKRPEFLSRAGVDTQPIGNSRLEITPGTAKEQEGKWVVKNKAIVKIL